MADIFYDFPKATLKKVKDILIWSHKNGIKTDVDMLDCSISYRRIKADKNFDDVLKHITRTSIGFFRVILRNQMNTWLVTTDVPGKRKDIVEVFIRSIDIGPVEYFIFIYLETAKLDYLKEKYALQTL